MGKCVFLGLFLEGYARCEAEMQIIKKIIIIAGSRGEGSLEFRDRVILVLHECIRNVPAVSLVLPAFDNTGSPPRQVVYPPGYMTPPWVTISHFLVGNREAELKPSIFPSLLFFLSFLFS